jgi:hypothetical protein
MSSPEYEASIVWDPAASAFVIKVAAPTPFRETVASNVDVVASKNVTLPVGVGPEPPADDTVAVKVTASPGSEGFGAEARSVTVGSPFTTWVAESELAL